ncbi:Chromatin modification-related protein png1 [Taphrina deformans PYCC 5710]|uniref:Chromatin modification-related protein n=1 Tax=Taphrina deformans (strain PYCC 5710 / ATCC 11124 / CBS 356.35 / IMI 108563 / JCM 9778 / NBRC 8474) TaxID=1097556 RepID=R4XHM8_TAPDE|nr:Chromatin modification-related protein png1 [Taphrina deformans PYCC 5710]|eukprot:CCG82922.1 Chromatin modification-related protein png1 [Taphrina deformans PYCC 5710]
MSEDAAYLVFDSLDNLPSELQNLYEDIRVIDVRATDSIKKIKTRDGQLGKFIKTNGSLEKNPKEEVYYPKIRADFGKTLERSYEKEELAKKALELLDRTLRKLDEETRKVVALERSGGSSGPSGASTPVHDRSPAVRDSAHLMPGQNTPLKNHKRARSSVSTRPAIPSGLGGPPLLPNGYPAPPATGGSDEEAGEDTTTYCFCEQVSYGEMVACDNDSCQREWFHYGCVGLKEPPIGKWYCSECTDKKA